jgi:uncharacterized protein (DUF1778 family)
MEIIIVSAETYDAFVALLDAPARDMPKFEALLTRPSVFSDVES